MVNIREQFVLINDANQKRDSLIKETGVLFGIFQKFPNEKIFRWFEPRTGQKVI